MKSAIHALSRLIAATLRLAALIFDAETLARPGLLTSIPVKTILYGSFRDFEKMQEEGLNNTVQLAASIVSAYIANNSLPMTELSGLISSVHSVIAKLAGNSSHPPAAEAQRPAVAIKKSIAEDHIICLEDGRKFKSLKRHLRTRYNLTPEQYRAKWQLPADYPMVAKAYAETRSRMAKDMGLGQQRRGKGKK